MEFTAKLKGICSRCNCTIEIGDKISWNRDKSEPRRYWHINCNTDKGDEALMSQKPLPIYGNTEAKPVAPVAQSAASSDLLDLIAVGLKDKLGVSQANAEAIANLEARIAELESRPPTVLEVRNGASSVVIKERQHCMFPKLLTAMSAKDASDHHLNIWIAGAAGTGKTSAAKKAAEALGLEFASTGALIDTLNIFGFFSPGTGQYVPTLFRRIWENGGVFLFDDCDGSNPAAMVELNNALANGSCSFPDAVVPKHADCVLVLTANTWGHGATTEYVGRCKQDGAFLDRFVRITWPIDESLETATAPVKPWCEYVQAVRKRVADAGLRVLVTPRATYYGSALLAAGMDWGDAIELTLKAAMTADQWEAVK